jgi:hypothetical protein
MIDWFIVRAELLRLWHREGWRDCAFCAGWFCFQCVVLAVVGVVYIRDAASLLIWLGYWGGFAWASWSLMRLWWSKHREHNPKPMRSKRERNSRDGNTTAP